MEENKDENIALRFVRRWLKEFNRIFDKVGDKCSSSNEEFVNEVLSEDMKQAKTKEEIELLEEKRKLMLEMCEEVDTYHAKMKEAEKSRDMEEWFEGEISSLVHETIPDADEKDVKEITDLISESFDDEIKIYTSLIEDEFAPDSTTGNSEQEYTNNANKN